MKDWKPPIKRIKRNDRVETTARLEAGAEYQVGDVFEYAYEETDYYSPDLVRRGMPERVAIVNLVEVIEVEDGYLIIKPLLGEAMEPLSVAEVDLQTRNGAIEMMNALSRLFQFIGTETMVFGSTPEEAVLNLSSMDALKRRLLEASLLFLARRDDTSFVQLSEVIHLSNVIRQSNQEVIAGIQREHDRVAQHVDLTLWQNQYWKNINRSTARAELLGIAKQLIESSKTH